MKNIIYSPTATDLGKFIRQWRLSKNYKQYLLAHKLDMSRAALSNIENGKTDISISRLYEIAMLLDVDIKITFSEQAAA